VLNGLPVREVTWIRAADGLLLAAASGTKTVYVSHDQGQSWKAEATTAFDVTGAVMQGNTLYVATRHHGILAREVPSHRAVASGSH
jgi:hypothetical protein